MNRKHLQYQRSHSKKKVQLLISKARYNPKRKSFREITLFQFRAILGRWLLPRYMKGSQTLGNNPILLFLWLMHQKNNSVPSKRPKIKWRTELIIYRRRMKRWCPRFKWCANKLIPGNSFSRKETLITKEFKPLRWESSKISLINGANYRRRMSASGYKDAKGKWHLFRTLSRQRRKKLKRSWNWGSRLSSLENSSNKPPLRRRRRYGWCKNKSRSKWQRISCSNRTAQLSKKNG